MKRSGAVYRKLKEIRYRYLSLLYKEHFKKMPYNCRYNRKHAFVDGDGRQREIRLCLFDPQNPGVASAEQIKINLYTIDVCEEQKHCARCNAFALKYTRDDIKNLFEEELKDIKVKAIKYPDLCALEWVLEQSVLTLGPLNWIEEKWIKLKNRISGRYYERNKK